MGIVAVLGMQRKRLLALFKKFNVIGVENAVTLQEINEKWGIGGIDPIRSRAIAKNIKILVLRGKIQKTDNDKYYLVVGK